MKVTWEIDEATRVEARYGGFGKEIIWVNGREVANRRNLGTKSDAHFQLDDGRQATITAKVQFGAAPDLRLTVGGQTFAQVGKAPLNCPSCNATVRSFDRFCDGCGKPLPTADTRAHEKQVRDATNGLFWLAGMFVVFGAIMFFVSRSQSTEALTSLAAMGADEMLEIEGEAYSVGALRDQISFEPWDVLITNAVLAIAMIGLGFWGRRAPLPAILVATAIYAMVIVTNAILDPKTLGQGIFVKIIVIMFLVRGLKAALALRAQSAASVAA
jgi:hypothetical protein